MKLNDLDFSVIKFSSIAFVIILLIGASSIISSWFFKTNMLAEYKKQRIRFASITQQYLAIDEDEKMIKQYYPQVVDLYNKGIIGDEHRLHWVETLRASSERIKLPELNYSISPQKEYLPEINVDLGEFKLYSSTMKLSISVLHEGDLLRLINDLNEHAEGIFTMTECNFLRPVKQLIEQRDGINIRVHCQLQWLNIRRADGSEIKLS